MSRFLLVATLLFAAVAVWFLLSTIGRVPGGPEIAFPREHVEARNGDVDEFPPEVQVGNLHRERFLFDHEEDRASTQGKETDSRDAPGERSTRPSDSDYLARAEGLVSREEFTKILVESQTAFFTPGESIVTWEVAEELYESTTHVVARLLRNYSPEIMNGLSANERTSVTRFALGSSVLQELLPKLRTLTERGSVEISGEFKPGRPDPAHGNIRANFFVISATGKDQVILRLRRGPWPMRFVVKETAVTPNLWSSLITCLYSRR